MPTTVASPVAPPAGVDLWYVPLNQGDTHETRLIANCSAREHERAARMPVAHRRRDFLVGRGVIRGILGAYLGVGPCHVEIAIGPRGKPFVASAQAPAFNVSHSHGVLVLAVTSGYEVGVDLEWIDPRLDVMAIARRFLSPEDAAHLSSLGAAAQAATFFRLWTRKEAYAKASGAGLGVGIGEDPASRTRTAPISDRTCTIVDIDPARGCVGALAYEAPPALVQVQDHASACLWNREDQ